MISSVPKNKRDTKLKTKTFSLRMQVFSIVFFVTLIAAIPVTLFLSNIYADQLRNGLTQKGRALTTFVAESVKAAVDFDDTVNAQETLALTDREPDLSYSVIFKTDGSIFATGSGSLSQDAPNMSDIVKTSVRFTDDFIHVATPVVISGKPAAVVQFGFSLARVHEDTKNTNLVGIVAATILALLIIVILSLVLGRLVVRPVIQITHDISLLGDGDLRIDQENQGSRFESGEIKSIRRALISAAKLLRQNVKSIRQTAEELSVVAHDLNSSTTDIGDEAMRQVSAISQSTATVNELEKTGQTSSDSAENILKTAQQSVKITGMGLDAVNGSISHFNDIRTQMDNIVSRASLLKLQFEEVHKIVTSVADVFQMSQLLAVNASIEADIAGEAGRGFSVVAKEMHELSNQSKHSMEQVRGTLKNIQNAMVEVTQASQLGREITDAGVESIEHTGQMIRQLSDVISGSADTAQKITVNAKQQVVGLKQMATAMHEINNATEKSRDSIHGLEQRSVQLNAKSEHLKGAVTKFTVDE